MIPSLSSASQLSLQLTGVVKKFGDKTAVAGLDLKVERGTILALLGPNGAGKTTTIEMCEGFITPNQGRISVLGLDPVEQSELLRPRIGVMLQGGGAYPGARVEEMLRLVASYSANPLDPDWLLHTLGLTNSYRTPYRRLSGGQQQRLALACAIVGRPELVFLDEPTAGLDAQARLLVWELIDALRRDGVTVVLTTHIMDEAEQLADQIVIIDHGAIVASGTTSELTQTDSKDQLRFTTAKQIEPQVFNKLLGAEYLTSSITANSYLIEGKITPEVIAKITAWCASHAVLTTDLRVERRSLEDVFLDLTGREVRV
ncbi:MAG: ABC transporter ATP-binding protein [Mycobacteriaceae bacterium]